MSRVIIKNLPKSISEDKLRELFSQKGLITDVQLKYTKDGNFRQFAFVGYQTEKEALEAIEHFNNTRVNTRKITVEHCALLGDSKKPKSWSKYATDSSAYINKVKAAESKDDKAKAENNNLASDQEEEEGILDKYKDDPMFGEFLEAHSAKDALSLLAKKKQKRKKNVEDEEPSKDEKEEEKQDADEIDEDLANKLANKDISDLEYMKGLVKPKRTKMEKKPKEKIDLFMVKLKNLPYSCKKKDIKDFFRPIAPYTVRLPRNIKGIAYVGFKLEKQFSKALLKDRSIIAGKQVTVLKYDKKSEELEQTETPLKKKWVSQEESLKNEEDIGDSGRIFIRNLSYTTVEDDLQQLFEKFGPIAEINVPVDSVSRKIKGFGTVTFMMPEHAVKAYTDLDGSILHGRMLHLLPGKPKDTDEENAEESTNYKQKKAKQQKAQAGSSHNWNALFLGQNAIAEVIADTFNTTKQAVLNPHGDGAAVRLALGETQIIAKTKKYLEEEGVHLNAFSERGTKRSKTIILVKNLPAHTHVRELRDLFQVHGDIVRIILPPSAITAIVEFLEPSEARKAFMKLAYSKFKSLPLYLEWAPENSLSAANNQVADKPVEMDNLKENKPQPTSEIKKAEVTENIVEEGEEEDPEPDTTLFVKNLNFKTRDPELRKHFEGCGKVHYATVALKKDPNDPTNKLSMGYGFVRFMHKATTDKALKTLQQSVLDGKSLDLKRSERTLQNDVTTTRKTGAKTKKQTGTKILVRNIPFQANRREIQELFKTFGEIKALRLPKKMTPGADSHRGFAFVDFTTNSDAKKAFEALSQSTHLYGRRLVLEWASTEEGVDEIRKRTADHFHQTQQEVKSKKAVFDLENT